MKKFTSLLFLVVAIVAAAQENRNDAISAKLKDYFKSPRENIHLHLNKSVYLSDESIWFKGYVIEKQSNLPFGATVNVYIQLLDEYGQVLTNRLYYSENSLVEGKFELDKTYPSGVYYLQVYTNYMNNFPEDESSVYRITIANPDDGGFPDVSQLIAETVDMTVHPESGVFLSGAENTFGVSIRDCHGNGVSASDIKLLDAKGGLLSSFVTNIHGYGRLTFIENGSGPYKIQYTYKGNMREKELPPPSANGASLSINNFNNPEKAFVKVRAGNQLLQRHKGKPLRLVIQKNATASFVDVLIPEGKNEQMVTVPKAYFSDGLNNIWLLDDQDKTLAERVVYSPDLSTEKTNINLLRKASDSILFNGSSRLKLAEVSISVLPVNTLANGFEKDVRSDFEFGHYLIESLTHAEYYLDGLNRAKHFELDNALLCQKSKYQLETMMTQKVDTSYTFDQGFHIRGGLNTKPSSGENQIRLSNLLQGINETVTLNQKNEFEFNNLVIIDSATVYFSVMDKGKIKPTKAFARLLNNNQKFNKKFYPTLRKCDPTQYKKMEQEIAFPKMKDAIEIEEVKVVGEKPKISDRSKTSALHNKVMGRAYKIDENDVAAHRDVLSFIQFHGYNVTIDGLNIIIRSRAAVSLRANSQPAIFLDDMPLQDLYQLYNFPMDNVDEIFFNDRGYGAGSIDGAVNGVIRIYTKRSASQPFSMKINSGSLVIKDGFQPYSKFENHFAEYFSPGFLTLGVIHWIPRIKTDEMGMFNFRIPNLNQSKVKLRIEGIASNGELISEIVSVDIP